MVASPLILCGGQTTGRSQYGIIGIRSRTNLTLDLQLLIFLVFVSYLGEFEKSYFRDPPFRRNVLISLRQQYCHSRRSSRFNERSRTRLARFAGSGGEPFPSYSIAESHSQSASHSPGSQSKKFVGIHFVCCDVTHESISTRQTAYTGNCPRCLKKIEIKIGSGGTASRFFTAG